MNELLTLCSCIHTSILCIRRIHTLIGHRAEISSAQFNYDCSVIATGSMDKTCKLWDVGSGTCNTYILKTITSWHLDITDCSHHCRAIFRHAARSRRWSIRHSVRLHWTVPAHRVSWLHSAHVQRNHSGDAAQVRGTRGRDFKSKDCHRIKNVSLFQCLPLGVVFRSASTRKAAPSWRRVRTRLRGCGTLTREFANKSWKDITTRSSAAHSTTKEALSSQVITAYKR